MKRAISFWNHNSKMFFLSKSHHKILSTHLVLSLSTHTHPPKLKSHTFEERRAYPFASSPKSTLVQAYVTWAPTSHWLTPIGLLHPKISLIFIYLSIFANTPSWGEMVRPLCLLTKFNTLVQAYVTWAPTSHWLTPLGLLYPYQSSNPCQPLS